MKQACASGFSHVWLFATLWTVAHQAPLSMGFSRQEYWSGLPCNPPGDHPKPSIKPAYLMSSVLAGRFFTTTASQAIKKKQLEILPMKNAVIKIKTRNSGWKKKEWTQIKIKDTQIVPQI